MTEDTTIGRRLPPGVREVKPGVFKLTVYAGIGVNGKQRQMSRTWREKDIALMKGYRLYSSELQKAIDDEKKAEGTVGELVAAWRKHRAHDSPATIKKRERILRQIERDLGKIRLEKLTARHVDEWYASLRAAPIRRHNTKTTLYRSEATIQHYHRTLASILRQAERWEMAGLPATRNAAAPRKDRYEVQLPTSAAVWALVGSAPSVTLRAAGLLAAACGLRAGEVCGLQWSDIKGRTLQVRKAVVQDDKGRLVVKGTKGRRARQIPLSPSTMRALAAYRMEMRRDYGFRWTKQSWVLPATDDLSGRSVRNPEKLSQLWAAQRKRHNAALTFHGLRHWYGSFLLNDGAPLARVSELMGHADQATTLRIYSHTLDNGTDQATASMERIVATLGPSRRALPVASPTT